MIYLERFRMPTQEQEENFLSDFMRIENRRTCYPTRYPFKVFRYRKLPEFVFEPITIFYGGNGSGKSTILNVIAESLHAKRGAAFNRSHFFEDYVGLCEHRGTVKSSRIITSDDVFDYMLNIRTLNEGLDRRREELLAEYQEVRHSKFQLQSLEDYDELKKHVDAVRLSGSKYAKSQIMEAVPGHSNGESALQFFTEAIKENGLYLLDEPENSLSAERQLELQQFLMDSVRFFGCQFLISTHSPFLLSMPGAKIYDLDVTPPAVRRWTELENVRVYQRFFKQHESEF